MLTIDEAFPGGNIRVISIENNLVLLDNDLRGCAGDWFYWAFRIRGAEGETIRFDFGEKKRVGYWGAAISHDLKTWSWSGGAQGLTAFTYTFAPDEKEVYFCHDMRYSLERFDAFSARAALPVSAFCISEQGNEVPCVKLGTGSRWIVLASRHHCCESTGTYVLEGMLEELRGGVPEGYSVLAVPFMDYDGVKNGDQGKNRPPHDHNRDYTDAPIYQSCRTMMDFAFTHDVRFAIDLHSPHHCALTSMGPGPYCDMLFMLRKNAALQQNGQLFSGLLAGQTKNQPDSMRYTGEADFEYNTGWNANTNASFSMFMAYRPGMELAFTLETTYYGTKDNQVTQSRLVAFGKCMAKALRAYISMNR